MRFRSSSRLGNAAVVGLATLWALALGPARAAAQSSEASASEASAASEVKETLRAMWDAIERGDLEAYAQHVHPDFTAFGESDTYLAAGKEHEVRGIGEYLERATGVHTEMHQPEVTVRGDVAWIVYYWTDSGYVEGQRFTSRGKSTRIFVREDGRWLCIHGHYTAVP